MLSRLAESLFWIGRYVERADDQARVLTVNLELSTESDSDFFADELCNAMGVTREGDCAGAGFRHAWTILGIDNDSPHSMTTALSNCRDSARRAREILSISTWESINRAYLSSASGRLAMMRPPLACREVRDSCSMILGALTTTMPRDDAWHFLRLGRLIERMDMTSRIIHSTIVTPSRPTHHHLVLEACDAKQAFVMTRGYEDTLESALDFLLRDPLSPRSIMNCLDEALKSVSALDPSTRSMNNETQRVLGALHARIEFMDPTDILKTLDRITLDIQDACSQATQSLSGRYFEGALSSVWHTR